MKTQGKSLLSESEAGAAASQRTADFSLCLHLSALNS
jgi:hypothetical protein